MRRGKIMFSLISTPSSHSQTSLLTSTLQGGRGSKFRDDDEGVRIDHILFLTVVCLSVTVILWILANFFTSYKRKHMMLFNSLHH